MACKSPNQWVLASPTTSSSSRSSRLRLASDVDVHEEQAETGDDAVLDHVRQLIVDLLVDDGRRSSSFRLSETARLGEAGSVRDVKRHSNNPEAEEDGSGSARERMLEEKLARALLELAGEQDNLRLAANAGNALLEELGTVREEIDALHDELEAAQADRDRSERQAQRLRDENTALETELQRYDAPYDAWDATGQLNALSHMQQLQQQQRRPSFTSRSGSFSRTDTCARCASHELEVTHLEQHADELRRRCLELELGRERDQQRQRELAAEIMQLQQCTEEQQLETARIQQDLEAATTQLDEQTHEVERVQAVRDTLRRTTRRLEAELDDLRERLARREELVTTLTNSKARAATQLQVAENRTARAQAETKRVTETLDQLRKQLEQQHGGRERSATRDSEETKVGTHEQDSQDMEQLLEDATRELEALRMENRLLRAETGSHRSRTRGRRRQTMCTGSAAITVADVLALGDAKRIRGTADSSSNSGSEFESIISPRSQLSPLEINPIQTDPENLLLSGDMTKRRKMSLELNWVDQAAETAKTAAPSCEAPSILKRPSALSRMSHVNENCVISGAIEVNNPDVRLYGRDGKRTTHRSKVADIEHVRARELPIEELRREAAETPPKSPLYLGLSFIACATAATAAGLLVRR